MAVHCGVKFYFPSVVRMFRHKPKKESVPTHGEEFPKAGYMDRVVGTLKQVAGRAFDEPTLYTKGKNQAKFGSQVIVHDRPVERHRPWVANGPVTDVQPIAHPQPLVVPQPAVHSQPVVHVHQAPDIHDGAKAVTSTGQTSISYEVPRHSISVPAESVASPFDQPELSAPSEPVRLPTPTETQKSRSRWF